MKHEADYDRPQPGRDGIVYTTPDPPWQPSPPVYLTRQRGDTVGTMTVHRRLDIRPAPEILQEQIDELRRRVAALEALARYEHDQ